MYNAGAHSSVGRGFNSPLSGFVLLCENVIDTVFFIVTVAGSLFLFPKLSLPAICYVSI